MEKMAAELNRREFLVSAGLAVVELSMLRKADAAPAVKLITLFDGKTLDGWLQIGNNATSLSAAQIIGPKTSVARIAAGSDELSLFLYEQLVVSVRNSLAGFTPSDAAAKAVISGLVKNLNQVVSGPSIYDRARFAYVKLRPETQELLGHSPGGQPLARLNMLLLEDAYPAELAQPPATGWTVKDGAMASTA